MSLVLYSAHVATGVLAAVPDPGAGIAPPGAEKVTTIVSWVAWVAFALCVVGVIFAGAMMAVGRSRGDGGEHASRLGWTFAGCIVIGTASALVGALT